MWWDSMWWDLISYDLILWERHNEVNGDEMWCELRWQWYDKRASIKSDVHFYHWIKSKFDWK